MLDFRRIEITDKPWIDEALKKSQYRGCEYTFGNNFVWRNVYNTQVCSCDGFYFIRFGIGDEVKYALPSGDMTRIGSAFRILEEHCREAGEPFRLYSNKKELELVIKQMYPEAEYAFNRDASDYIYLAEDLAELKGKKYHSKRNHLNRFYENDWSFEPLTAANIAECIAMNERWCAENLDECPNCDSTDQSGKEDEACIVRCSFKYYDKLGYTGGVLRVNGEVQAFTFGEQSADDTFVVHVEKALRDYQGTYTAINREFVRSLGGRYKYINREEDTGAENLRKAKLSYHPLHLEEKYDILIK